MYNKQNYDFLKYKYVFLFDLIAVQISFFISYYLRHHSFYSLFGYGRTLYFGLDISIILVQIIIAIVTTEYKKFSKRGFYIEIIYSLLYVAITTLVGIFYLFACKQSASMSRLFIMYFAIISLIIIYVSRSINKLIIKNKPINEIDKIGLIIIASINEYKDIIDDILEKYNDNYSIRAIGIIEDVAQIDDYNGIVVYPVSQILDNMKTRWIDECYIKTSTFDDTTRNFINEVQSAGIVVHFDFTHLIDPNYKYFSEEFGNSTVITSSYYVASQTQVLMKRLLDIIGGLVGLVFTALITVFVGPIIYFTDPGPIFFKQKRIGLNGRIFYIYKFRSMYKDAEARKKELLSQNELNSNFMFKMENDPRILKGVGNFIRKTSLDEFPQFLNVLKGDMSLVGTRPPTLDEWNIYNLKHRVRMSVKPGITGMWQVSGRSDIVDFDEVVELDKKYMVNWNIGKDIKIILKTIGEVIYGKGAK